MSSVFIFVQYINMQLKRVNSNAQKSERKEADTEMGRESRWKISTNVILLYGVSCFCFVLFVFLLTRRGTDVVTENKYVCLV